MSEKLYRAIIAQEKLNDICLQFNESNNLAYNIFEEIKKDNTKDDIIDIIYSNFFLNNRNSENNKIKGVTDFIEQYYENSDMLHEMFLQNKGLAEILIGNYCAYFYIDQENLENDEFYDRRVNFEKSSKKDKEIALKISPIYNYLNCNCVTDIARFYLFNVMAQVMPEIQGSKCYNEDLPIIDNIKIYKSVIVGDAYTYMCYNNDGNEYDRYIKMIEENSHDFDKLWNLIINNSKCLYNFLFYIVNLFSYNEYYSELYNEISQINPNFKEYLKKINPYYIIDEMRDVNEKKYRK